VLGLMLSLHPASVLVLL